MLSPKVAHVTFRWVWNWVPKLNICKHIWFDKNVSRHFPANFSCKHNQQWHKEHSKLLKNKEKENLLFPFVIIFLVEWLGSFYSFHHSFIPSQNIYGVKISGIRHQILKVSGHYAQGIHKAEWKIRQVDDNNWDYSEP